MLSAGCVFFVFFNFLTDSLHSLQGEFYLFKTRVCWLDCAFWHADQYETANVINKEFARFFFFKRATAITQWNEGK